MAADSRADAEGEREDARARQLAEQRHVAGTRRGVLPRHRAVAREILPAVARADVAGARAPEGIALRARRPRRAPARTGPASAAARGARRDRRPRHSCSVPVPPRCGASNAYGRKVRIARERDVDQQRVALRAGHDAAASSSKRAWRWTTRTAGMPGARSSTVCCHSRFTSTQKPSPVGHDEAEIANLRNVDARVVHLVEDAAADREPEPRAARGAADHLLGAAAPGRRQAGAAGRRAAARGTQAGRGMRAAHPARAAPSIATSGFTMSLVGMALTNGDSRPLSSKRWRKALSTRNFSIFCAMPPAM